MSEQGSKEATQGSGVGGNEPEAQVNGGSVAGSPAAERKSDKSANNPSAEKSSIEDAPDNVANDGNENDNDAESKEGDNVTNDDNENDNDAESKEGDVQKIQKRKPGGKQAPTAGQVGVKRPRSQTPVAPSNRTASVQGLTIPFRTIKKAMKQQNPDVPIIQNEAAIMATMAAELFLKTLARQSHANAKHRGRNTIRYEDVSEARTQEPSYAFLEPLLP